MQGSSTEVCDELYVSLAVTGTCGNGECTQTFCGILYAETAGKHTITGSVLYDVGVAQTYAVHGTCHGIGPLVKVFLSMKDNGGVACGTA